MKILFYIESLRPGGKERRLVELIKGLIKDYNFEVELVLMGDEIHYKEILDLDVKIHYTKRKFIKKDPRPFYLFYKIARKSKPDIIHVWGDMLAIYSIPAKLILKKPLINSQITSVPLKKEKPNLFNRISFHYSDLLLSNTEIGIDRFLAPKNKSKCIYNGFDFNRIKELSCPKEVRKRFHVKTDLLVGMVATFSSKKDYPSYVLAAADICNQRSDVTFLCIGDGDSSHYKQMVPEHHHDRVLFLGPQNNIESIINACDIGVLASISEGVSNTILEFMAIGKPVVATGEGGTYEIIQNNNNGIHIPANNHGLLSDKIMSLIKDEDLRTDLGTRAKKTVKESFNLESMIDNFVAEYMNFLN